jgi:rRNA maturation RNase YbeY
LGSIEFYSEGIDFVLENEGEVSTWISDIVESYKYEVAEVSYIFLSDESLLQMNIEHLDHDTYTDILTFVLNEEKSTELLVDMYISVDRVRENALGLKVPMVDELHRVMIHGMLHAIGLDDKETTSQAQMRKAEDLALSLRQF